MPTETKKTVIEGDNHLRAFCTDTQLEPGVAKMSPRLLIVLDILNFENPVVFSLVRLELGVGDATSLRRSLNDNIFLKLHSPMKTKCSRCSLNATPVHAACRRGSRHVLQLLLECGGDLRLRDDRGRTPQDWALEHADPQYRRKLVTFINTRRAIAYRFEDPMAVLEDDPSAADVSGGATNSIRRRFGRGKKLWCTERLKPDGGFGVVSMYTSSIDVGLSAALRTAACVTL